MCKLCIHSFVIAIDLLLPTCLARVPKVFPYTNDTKQYYIDMVTNMRGCAYLPACQKIDQPIPEIGQYRQFVFSLYLLTPYLSGTDWTLSYNIRSSLSIEVTILYL